MTATYRDPVIVWQNELHPDHKPSPKPPFGPFVVSRSEVIVRTENVTVYIWWAYESIAAEQWAYYADPRNLQVSGPGRKPKRSTVTELTSIRFNPEMLAEIKKLSYEDHMTVSSWVRQAVEREIQSRKG